MIFELLDQSKDRNIGEKSLEVLFNKKNLLQNAKSNKTLDNKTKKGLSVLKNEKEDSTIIKEIVPTFPLHKEISLFQTIQMENEDELKIKISDILSQKHPLDFFVKNFKMDQVLNIEQAIYRSKIEGMNEIMDKNL